MDKLNFSSTTNLYRIGDSRGIIKTAFRQKYRDLGLNFHAWKDGVVIKLARETLLELLSASLTAATAELVETPIVRHSHFGANSLEFYVQSEADQAAVDNFIDNSDLVKVFVDLNFNDSEDYEEDIPNETEILIANFEAFGHQSIIESFVKKLMAAIKEHQQVSKSSLVNWVFTSDDGTRDKTFHIKKTWEMDRSFYPWVETSLQDYYRSFLESRAQIMVLYGPPGTGKTSFIRDMLCEMNLNAYISYDMKILCSDSTFVSYVTGSIFDAIVIEDADELLTAARGDQNKVIAKILNVSDGLIKLPRKKLIFTTNLKNVDEIDHAIIRPGRCFDVMEFRPLTATEAEATAKSLGISLSSPTKKSYTLAELFFAKDLQDSTDPFTRKHGEQLKKRSVGFY
jgi:SpoVK/Ycf46/Vps4 family AAA+-type ATPase